ncbi:phosphate signaling complex protein PhoU [bacterium]|nr:phosphate signaling complex protein PhoU [bacterium]
MSLLLRKEIEKAKKSLLILGGAVEHQLNLSVQSLLDRDDKLARRVIENDSQIDKLEVDLEEECLKILALYQPVAMDLRYIISIIKINSDLERIGDLAVNIAERAEFLSGHVRVKTPFDFTSMADKVKAMLNKSLNAFVDMKVPLACEVLEIEEQVDELNREVYRIAVDEMKKAVPEPESFLQMISVSRYCERIADHCTNIAEDVIYMAEGKIVRHKTDGFMPPGK